MSKRLQVGCLAKSLSGGNLQKVYGGKGAYSENQNLLIVAQPTWGVDAGLSQ